MVLNMALVVKMSVVCFSVVVIAGVVDIIVVCCGVAVEIGTVLNIVGVGISVVV